MKRFSLFLISVTAALMAIAQPARPKLVVGIVVDQMRWDYMHYYHDRFTGGGFDRLLAEGYSCNNCIIDYVPTVTACGHASIYTGSVPAFHGVAGNNYFIYGKHVSSVQDDTANPVGSNGNAGRRSPRNLLATTIGDELRLATDFKSRVYGVALKDRAAILPAGHAANGAFWVDRKNGCFITSDYYMKQLPPYVHAFNSRHAQDMKIDPMKTPMGVSLTFELAKEILRNERLGQTDATDMLTISVSSTDMIAHTYGTRSPETNAAYLQLDRDLADFFNTLDATVGKGNYLLFLSADHGGTNNYKYSTEHHLPSWAWAYWGADVATAMNDHLAQQFGVKNLIKDFNEYSIYLNNHAIDSAGVDREAVKREAVKFFCRAPQVDRVVDIENIQNEPVPQPLKERIIKGYHPERSGELFVVLKPGGYAGEAHEPGSNHGTWSTDDSHIPMVFMGWHVPHGETARPTGMTDIAATICAMLHIQMPSACIGTPVPALTTHPLSK